MNATVPKSIRFEGRTLNLAGAGRSPGALQFYDALGGRTIEVFHAQIVRTGPYYALAIVSGNPAMPLVRVDRQLLNGMGDVSPGTVVMIGAITHLPEGPKARAAWPARVANGNQHRKSSPRTTGMVVDTPTGKRGWIRTDGDGHQVHVDSTQLIGGGQLAVGLRVTFTEVRTGRGLVAIQVLPLN